MKPGRRTLCVILLPCLAAAGAACAAHKPDSCLVLARATSDKGRARLKARSAESGVRVLAVVSETKTKGGGAIQSYLIADPVPPSERSDDKDEPKDPELKFERLKVEEETPAVVEGCQAGDPACAHPDWSLRMIDLDAALQALDKKRQETGRPSLKDAPPGSYPRRQAPAGGAAAASSERAVLVGHPDTGYTFHPALGTFPFGPTGQTTATRVRPTAGYGFRDCNCNTYDLQIAGISGIRNRGHGTATSSQIIGVGAKMDVATGMIRGVAQGAELMPLRSATGVIIGEARAFHVGLAVRDASWRAAANDHYANQSERWYDDCVRNAERCRRGPLVPGETNASFSLEPADVFSISMGGPPLLIKRAYDFLERAMLHAERNGVIAVAAAGQGAEGGIGKIIVTFAHGSGVVYPGAFDSVLAVGATNVRGLPWKAMFRGPEVAVMAPGEQVWNAKYDWDKWQPPALPPPIIAPGKGTSFSTAIMAGVAALWLDYHGGRDGLLKEYQHPALIPVALKYALVTKGFNTPKELCQLSKDRAWPADMQNAVCDSVAEAETQYATGKFGRGVLDAHKLLTGGLPRLAEVCEFVRKGGDGGRWRRKQVPEEIADVCDAQPPVTSAALRGDEGEGR